MRLIFLGTGGAHPTKDRNVSSLAMQVGGSIFLFDCGEGTQRQLLYTNLSFQKIKRIYISHLHGDHFFGLPGLIQTMGLNQRKDPLIILGPPGCAPQIESFINSGFGFYPFEIEVREVTDNQVENVDDLNITTRIVDHSVPTLAIGIQENEKRGKFNREKALELNIPPGPMFSRLTNGETIEIDGKTISPDEVMGLPRPGKKFVHCGDTSPCESIKQLAQDADVLVYESTFDHELVEKANNFKHSTNIQAATLAKECNVKDLILNHISPRYSTEEVEAMLAACREVHPETTAASDFADFLITADGLKLSRER